MVRVHRIFVNTVVILLFIQTNSHAKKSHKCPIGFEIAYSSDREDPICYRRKGPERFNDAFKDCAGNLFTWKTLSVYNVTDGEEDTIWTEFKTLYPQGPIVDYSYTETTGDLIPSSEEVNFNRYDAGEEENVCVAYDPIIGLTAYSCDDKFYRYCFVKPYVDYSIEVCEKFRGSARFSSPLPTSLSIVTPVGNGTVRATWRQAEELCEKRGSSLLSRGWRYINHPCLGQVGMFFVYPLGVVFNSNHTQLRYSDDAGSAVIDPSEQYFEDRNFSSNTMLGAVTNPFWSLVNSSYIFYDVICEKHIELKDVTMTVKVDNENKIVLSLSEPVDKSKIHCFTDSVFTESMKLRFKYPESVKFTLDKTSNFYILSPKDDGYYWCIHKDSENYKIAESNKALFIREKQSLMFVYSVKFKIKDNYEFDNFGKIFKVLRKKLAEYIYYVTQYVNVNGKIRALTNLEDKLKEFKSSIPKVNLKDMVVIRSAKIRRLYLDKTTVLAHVELNKDMMPVPKGKWDDMEVLFMRPAYYCNGTEAVETKPLDSSTITTGCTNFTCVGDFNEGVQWINTLAMDCEPKTTTTARLDAEVTVHMPTVGTLTPDLPTREYSPLDNSSEETTEHRPRPENITIPPILENTTLPSTPTIYLDPTNEPVITEVPTTPIITRPPFRPPRPPTTTEPVVTVIPTQPITTTTPTPTTTIPSEPTTRPPPEQQLQQVMDDLQSILNNDTEPVFLESINGAFDQVDNLLSDSDDLAIPGQLLHLLDGIGSRIELNETNEAVAVRPNLALLVAESNPGVPVTGIRIAATNSDVFTDEAFEIIRGSVNSSHLQTEETEVLVELPETVANSQRRISFVVFRNDRAFPHSDYSVNSRVLSVNVQNVTHFQTGQEIEIRFRPMIDTPERNQSRACAYWQFLENGTGQWSQEGCTFVPSTEEGILDMCRCNHLTHFAEILIPRTTFPEAHETALELITIVGCSMSIIGLLLVGLTAIMFRSWRRDFSNKIWLQLCMAILILVSCFLVVVFVDFTEHNVVCMLTGVLLHYSTLASFCWMLVAAVLSYRRLVVVFTRDASHKLLKASAFSWGAPCAVVGILLSIGPHSYAGRFEGDVPTGSFCYPSGLSLWLAVYAPIAVMLVANWTLFILIVRSVFATRRIQRHGDSNEAMRCASVSCLLVFLFGLPWIFGLFLENLVTVYLFTITGTFQGFVLFLFFVLGNKKTRDMWLNKLKIKQTRKVPVTSSTYTNRSTNNPGWRGGSGGATSIEAKASKPRSLASPDESRFS